MGSATVVISVKALSQADVTSGDLVITTQTQEWTGSAITPTPSLKYKGIALVAGVDYEHTYAYDNNVSVGTSAEVIIEFAGNYTGSATGYFEITAMDLTGNAKVSVDSTSPHVYTGSDITPTPDVYYDGNLLTVSVDYTYGYSSNKNAGQATITISFMGNYSGTASTTFSITPAILNITVTANQNKVFGASDPAYEYTVTGELLGSDTVALLSGALSRAVGENVGNYNVTLGTLSAENYTINLLDGANAFTITAKTIAQGDVTSGDLVVGSISAQSHTGSAITPTPSVVYDGKTLVAGTDFDFTYNNNVDVGTSAAVTITFKGNYSGSASVTFEIVAKDDGFPIIFLLVILGAIALIIVITLLCVKLSAGSRRILPS